ncbi:MAG: putative toxin-antitoxin system toxin component, PIN family [Nanoarchaeota archaeon]
MPKLVLDTNTIISGLLWKGNEFELLLKIEYGKAQFFVNREILAEIYQVLNYPRITKYIRKAELRVDKLFEKVNSLSHTVIGPKLEENVVKEDKDDDKFIECALNAKADIIVTGDEHLLKLKEYKHIKIMTTADVLELFES